MFVRMKQADFTSHMGRALDEAKTAAARGEVPVGAVLVGPDGTVLAQAGNETRARHDPTAHAEILVIREACAKLGADRLTGCALWVTLEPCPMCASAIAWAHVGSVYYGASDPKSGGIEAGPQIYTHKTTHHRPELYPGIAEEACSVILKDFFRSKR